MNNNIPLGLTIFILFITTIVFAKVLGVYRSQKWFLIALIPGFMAGFILGMTTQVYSLSPGFYLGFSLGVVSDLVLVGGGWLTRYYRDNALKRLQKLSKKTIY